VFHDFRQDLMNKLKRKSVKASTIKDKLSLGVPASVTGAGAKPVGGHGRSQSVSMATILRRKSRSGRPSSYSVDEPEGLTC